LQLFIPRATNYSVIMADNYSKVTIQYNWQLIRTTQSPVNKTFHYSKDNSSLIQRIAVIYSNKTFFQ